MRVSAFVSAALLAGVVTVSLGAAPAKGAWIGLEHVGVTGGIDPVPVTRGNKTFYKAQFYVLYSGSGTILFSANDDGTGATEVDDVVTIKVPGAPAFTHDYSNNCTQEIESLPPQDLTSLFKVGINKVTVTLKDKCGGGVSSSPLWITTQP